MPPVYWLQFIIYGNIFIPWGAKMLFGLDILSITGFGMVIAFMTLIMTKRLSPLVALITIPALFAIFFGFGTKWAS
jgi:hypothetical protein